MAAKAGVLEWNAARETGRGRDQFGRSIVMYACPCGKPDHDAYRVFITSELSPVLNCLETGQQWMVKAIPVADIIRVEEDNYAKLLDRAFTLVPKVIAKRGYSPETLEFLRDTHGIPNDIVEDICTASR